MKIYMAMPARFVFEDIIRFQKGEPLCNEITASSSKTMTR